MYNCTAVPRGGDALPDAAIEGRRPHRQVSRQQCRHCLVADLAAVRYEAAQRVQPAVSSGVVDRSSFFFFPFEIEQQPQGTEKKNRNNNDDDDKSNNNDISSNNSNQQQ